MPSPSSMCSRMPIGFVAAAGEAVVVGERVSAAVVRDDSRLARPDRPRLVHDYQRSSSSRVVVVGAPLVVVGRRRRQWSAMASAKAWLTAYESRSMFTASRRSPTPLASRSSHHSSRRAAGLLGHLADVGDVS